MIKVNEIFTSIDGEGIRSGYPVTFIRLFDCNLRCSYCDTMYAVEGNDYRNMSISDIISMVNQLGYRRITLTGGEPLLHKEEVYPLLEELITLGYEINIETNGAVSLLPFEKLRDTTNFNKKEYAFSHASDKSLEEKIENRKITDSDSYILPKKHGNKRDMSNPVHYKGHIIYTLDYKSPSSAMNHAMLLENFNYLQSGDVIKFVVGTDEDLWKMKQVVTELLPTIDGLEIFVSPIFGVIEPARIVDFIIMHHLECVRMQLQMHKFIWDPNARGV